MRLTSLEQVGVLKGLVSHDAQSVAKVAIELFETTLTIKDIKLFCHPETRLSMEGKCNSREINCNTLQEQGI